MAKKVVPSNSDARTSSYAGPVRPPTTCSSCLVMNWHVTYGTSRPNLYLPQKKNTDSGHVPLQRRSHIFEKITDRWNVTTSSKLSPVDANGDESQPLSRRASSTNPDLTDDARYANPNHHLFWSQKSKGTPGETSKGCRIAEIAEEKLKENPRKRTIYPLAAAKTASNIGQIIKLGDKPKIRAVPS